MTKKKIIKRHVRTVKASTDDVKLALELPHTELAWEFVMVNDLATKLEYKVSKLKEEIKKLKAKK